MTLRERLDEITRELDQAQRAPMLFAMNAPRVVALVVKVGGLLAAMVDAIEPRSSNNGKDAKQ